MKQNNPNPTKTSQPPPDVYWPWSTLPKPARVQQRFGIGTLFMAVAVFSVLFYLLRLFNVPGEVVLKLLGLFGAVAVAQLIFVEVPRVASIAAGIAYVASFVLVQAWLEDASLVDALASAILIGGFTGVPLGYLAGGVMALIFLPGRRKEKPTDANRNDPLA